MIINYFKNRYKTHTRSKQQQTNKQKKNFKKFQKKIIQQKTQNIILLLRCIPNYITIYICKEKRKQLYTKRKVK